MSATSFVEGSFHASSILLSGIAIEKVAQPVAHWSGGKKSAG